MRPASRRHFSCPSVDIPLAPVALSTGTLVGVPQPHPRATRVRACSPSSTRLQPHSSCIPAYAERLHTHAPVWSREPDFWQHALTGAVTSSTAVPLPDGHASNENTQINGLPIIHRKHADSIHGSWRPTFVTHPPTDDFSQTHVDAVMVTVTAEYSNGASSIPSVAKTRVRIRRGGGAGGCV